MALSLNLRKLILAVAVLLASITNADSGDDDAAVESKWKFSWENDVNDAKAYGNLAFAFSKEYIEKHQSVFMQQLIREMEGFTLRDMHIEHEAGDTKFAT